MLPKRGVDPLRGVDMKPDRWSELPELLVAAILFLCLVAAELGAYYGGEP